MKPPGGFSVSRIGRLAKELCSGSAASYQYRSIIVRYVTEGLSSEGVSFSLRPKILNDNVDYDSTYHSPAGWQRWPYRDQQLFCMFEI